MVNNNSIIFHPLIILDNAGNTPLHLACKKSMYQSVLALVDAGADLSVFIGITISHMTTNFFLLAILHLR
jgi:ankyrin repeat protein